MPLITLCGFPCVGKTKFAALLASHIEKSGNFDMKCVVINEETLHINKPEHYKSAAQEKVLRQNLKSAVEHELNADTVVILDSCNYIKGYRYELYCIARAMRTPHCVVHVAVENTFADQWNEDRPDDSIFDKTSLGDLRRRFEAPNECNRWDKPLFHVNMMADEYVGGKGSESLKGLVAIVVDSGVSDTKQDCESVSNAETLQESTAESSPPPATETVFTSWKPKKAKPQTDDATVVTHGTSASSCFIRKPVGKSNVYFSGSRAVDGAALTTDGPSAAIHKICSYFITADAPQPNAATNTVRHSSANLLYQIDKVSQEITQNIFLQQQKQGPDTPLIFDNYGRFSLRLPRRISMAELQRQRRQYIKVNSQHPPEDAQDAGTNYLEFLSNHY